VVEDPAEALCCGEGVSLEAVLMQGVQHPNVVGLKTFKMAQTAAGNTHLWLVLDYCDQGTFSPPPPRFFPTMVTLHLVMSSDITPRYE